MTIALKRFAWAATGAGMLLVSATGSAFAETTVSGNGASSTNTVLISTDCLSSVTQGNKTVSYTDVTSIANTGKNAANQNTGGTTSIDTGDASSTVSVAVLGGSNSATSPTCCGCEGVTTDTLITGNGASSGNTVDVLSTRTQLSEQRSKTKVSTFVFSKATTRKNKAKKNTGSGAAVTTGASDSAVDVTVAGGSNTLQ